MKTLLLTLMLTFSIGVWAQIKVSASIDKNCNSIPATINVASGQTAFNFSISQLQAGKNCYNGSSFPEKGFVIKDSAGRMIFRYQINGKGNVYAPNGNLNQLKLESGIYYVHVDGGNGARLDLKFKLK